MAARACSASSPHSRAAAAAAAKLSSASAARPARCHASPCRQRTSASAGRSGTPRASASSNRAAASAKARERSACAAAVERVLDRAAVPRDRSGGAEVERELVDDPVAPALGHRLQRLAHAQVQGRRAERAQALVDRPAQQLVADAVHEARVLDLVEHPGVQALVERAEQRLVVHLRRRAQDRERDAARAHGDQLQELAQRGRQAGDAIGHHLADALRDRGVGRRGRPTASWSSMCRHTSPTRNALPSVSSTSCSASSPSAPRTESPLRSTSSWTSATSSPPRRDPHHAVQPVQLGQRRSERLRQLAIALAEQRQHDDRRRAQRPREVTQEDQRRCVGPLHVIEHEHRRRVASEPRQQRRQRCVQLVALGIGVLGRVAIAAVGSPAAGAQAWQQAGQRRRVAVGARLGLVGSESCEGRLERLDERLVGRAHRRVAGAVEHAHPAGRDVLGELPRQPRLAAARLAAHQGDLPPVGARPVEAARRAGPAPRSRPTNGIAGRGRS